MILKDIVTKRTYTSKGEEKTQWLNVGTYKKTDDDKEFIELNMFPNTPYYIFEKKPKQEKMVDSETGEVLPEELQPRTLTDEQKATMTVEQVADMSDIPF